MRVAALVCALALLVSPYFFAYCEVERLLGWPQAVYRWFDPWLPLADDPSSVAHHRRPALDCEPFHRPELPSVTNPNL